MYTYAQYIYKDIVNKTKDIDTRTLTCIKINLFSQHNVWQFYK